MRHQVRFRVLALLPAVWLTACGGDAFTGTATDPTQTPVTSSVASVQLLTNKSQLRTGDEDADQGVTVTAIVRDGDGVLLPSVPVEFSTREVDPALTNGICASNGEPQGSGGALQVVNAIAGVPGAALTTEAGLAQAILTSGGDDRNRCVEVIATASSRSDSTFVPVVGTVLSVTGPNVVATNADATFTVNVADGNGLGIPNQLVTISTEAGNSNPVRNPNEAADEGTPTATVVTDESGSADFSLTGLVGGDELVTVSSLGQTESLSVSVSSVSIEIAADPNDADCDTAPNSSLLEIGLETFCTIRVTLTDTSAPDSVGGRSITLLSTRGDVSNDGAATTDANGVASFQLSAQPLDGAGPAILQAAAELENGDSAETSLAIEFVATNPAVVEVQAEPSIVQVNDSAVIRAVVRDGDNNLVKNSKVDFSLNDTTSGELSAATKVTNSQGVAQVTFNASGTPSASNGVRITARVRGTSVENTVPLTVGGTALRVTFGTGNEIIDDNTVYRKDYTLIITDAEGNPPPNDTTFRLAIRTLGYQKGFYFLTEDDKWAIQYTIETPQAFPLENGSVSLFGCAREDLNFNGILDPGEDDPSVGLQVRDGRQEFFGSTQFFFGNNSGTLEPGNVVTIQVEDDVDEETAEAGITNFQLVYPQQFGNWVAVELRAIATVAGTETIEAQRFILEISANDVSSADVSPPGNPSPFGVSDTCDQEG